MIHRVITKTRHVDFEKVGSGLLEITIEESDFAFNFRMKEAVTKTTKGILRTENGSLIDLGEVHEKKVVGIERRRINAKVNIEAIDEIIKVLKYCKKNMSKE